VHAQDGGWTISASTRSTRSAGRRLHGDGTIEVDWRSQRHGIFREIGPLLLQQGVRRVYGFDVIADEADGSPWPYTREQSGANVRLKIGDPDRFVSGRQSYRISYRVRNALNLSRPRRVYWNVNGFDWPVPARATSAVVRLPAGWAGTCFEGVAAPPTPAG
jgi:hypothetical protein